MFDAMFNSDIKEKYLDSVTEAVAHQLRPLFSKSEITENLYKKDIYDFTSVQILELIRSFDQTTIGSVKEHYHYCQCISIGQDLII